MAMAAAPRPKSPPASPDPCGRHRLQLAVDALHREIGFLEGEIDSIEGVHAASKCCKEVDEFIGRNGDPFITITSSEKRNTDQSHHFLKKFRARTCLSYLSRICCCGGCSSSQLKRPSCCCSYGALQSLRRCCSRGSCLCCCFYCRCRVGCASCCRPPCCCNPCSVQCPRCSCDDCACPCPRCSCAYPRCSATCCIPRCCLCL